ncbi:MAG: helix-turn-helix domain-containing protein [Prevotella sp.]|jgi:hypothetical protein
MTFNQEFSQAWDFVEHTGIGIFLTGKAGTGKTTFLKYVQEHSTKRIVIVAPSGVAAINAGGVTIHSFFQLPLSPYVPGAQIQQRYDFSKDKRRILQTLDMLIIDEISMVRADLLDEIDNVLRRFRRHSLPFGGVQLLMIGDLSQLSPVVTAEDEEILGQYYQSPFFFDSDALKRTPYVTIQLKQVFRQSDQQFLSILNHIRDGKPTDSDLQRLNNRLIPGFRPNKKDGYIRLVTHNRMADFENRTELNRLGGKLYTFDAVIEGDFPEMSYPTDAHLELRIGAQVMFIRNDPEGEFYNGKIGIVHSVTEDGEVEVECEDSSDFITVEPQTWENAKYKLNEKNEIEAEVQGTFTQLPLRLAWAITIHKSQGLTFDHAIIDAGRSFTTGQVYVALSRCRTLEGIVLATPIMRNAIKTDHRVDQYINHQEEAAQRSIEDLPRLKEGYYKQELMSLFDFLPIQQEEDQMMRLFIGSLGKTYPTLTYMHKKAVDTMQKEIMEVAQKWMKVMSRMTVEQLQNEAFQQRVKDSAKYFSTHLHTIFDDVLRHSEEITVKNQTVAKQLHNILDSLKTNYGISYRLLRSISNVGFNLQTFQQERANAILGKPEEQPQTRSKRKESKRKLEKKEPKLPSYEQTFKMFKEGMSVEQIAKERNLTTTTIFEHLLRSVAEGKIHLEELMSKNRITQIRKVIDRLGIENGMKPIKESLGDGYSYGEIRAVIQEKLGVRR